MDLIRRLVLVLCLLLVPASLYAQSTKSGSLTATGSVTLNTSGYGSIAIQITGSFTATVTFEGSVDGSTYQALNVTPTNSTSATTTATTTGVWVGAVGGLKFMRARVSSYTSGTVTISLQTAPSGGSSGGGGGGGSAPSGTIASAVPSTASPIAVKDNSGNLAYPTLDVSGNLLVAVTGAGSGGTSSVDGATYTASTTAGTPLMIARDDTSPTAVAEDKVGIARGSANRNQYMQIRDGAGNERGANVSAGNALLVDASATTQPVSGTVAATQSGTWTVQPGNTANTTAWKVDGSAVTQPISAASLPLPSGAATAAKQPSLTDNTAFTQSTTIEVPISGLYTTSYTAATSGRSTVLQMTSAGEGYINLSKLQGAVPSATNYLPMRPTDGTNYITPSTDYTHDGALTPASTTGPMMLWRASTSTPTAVSAADDAVMGWADLNGRPQVNISQINGVTPLMGAGNTGTGSSRVTIVSDQVITPHYTATSAVTTDSALGCYLQSAATTNSTNCKASAGNFYGVRAVNTTATLYYLRLYNASSAPTCSSATNFIESIPIPASTTGAGIMAVLPIPIAYSTGISFCFTGGGSSTDNTSAATGVYLTIYYK